MVKKRKGCYKRIGRLGVWDADAEESKELVDTRVEEEGADEITEHAANMKSDVLQ